MFGTYHHRKVRWKNDHSTSLGSYRWATEDPNPTAKIAETAHLVAQGEAGIAKGLDPDFVQSVREMDELEGLVEPRQIEGGDQYHEGDVRGQKRARIEPAQGESRVEEVVVAEQVPAPAAPMGLLSANAVESLKFMATLRQQNGGKALPKVQPKAVGGLGGLADYGSDSD